MWDFKTRTFLHSLKDQADAPPVKRRCCDVPGCPHLGEYRAPKSRYSLAEYYWFCLDHVRDYNQNWDFFKGMSQSEIEHHMHRTVIWDRPSWRSTQAGLNESASRQKIYEHFASGEGVSGSFSFSGTEDSEKEKARIDLGSIPHPAVEALSVMGLAPPVGWEEVRTRYKKLAKKYHPDTNKKDPAAEELLKKINLAYSILKLSYQHYAQLDEEK